MSTKHTPGPWAVNPVRAQVDSPQPCDDGSPVPICALCWPTKYRSEDETEANAFLIAAAPDLLDLVIQYRNDLRHPPSRDSIERRLVVICAAIARATGEA